jgi:hypothetical protein
MLDNQGVCGVETEDDDGQDQFNSREDEPKSADQGGRKERKAEGKEVGRVEKGQ